MKKCIFCEKTETELTDGNCFNIEHIIPKALGNDHFILHNVCKNCNSGLGTYVDSYFVDHPIVKIIREKYKISGQSGKLPNPFSEVMDQEGHRYRVLNDKNGKVSLEIIPCVKENDNAIRIVSQNRKEALEMMSKRFSKGHYSDNAKQIILDQINNASMKKIDNEFEFSLSIDINRFYLEALKIAYEYGMLKLGDEYFADVRATEIRKFLQNAIAGEMKDSVSMIEGVYLRKDEMLSNIGPMGCHFLCICSDGNKLFANITLFMCSIFAFQVLLSNDAQRYCDKGIMIYDTIEIDTN
ncbi:MAG: HNH endonuclease [Clostridiales bacterium]|nr:HNH endonuclease [Clostridiales bacterium]